MAKETRHVDIRVTSNVGKEMTKGTAAAGGLSGALKGVGASASMATGGIRAMTAALVSSGVGAIVVAAGALAAGFLKLATVSKDFARDLSTLKAISGSTAEEMKMLSDNAKELGRSTSFTASEVVKLQTEYAKLGFSTSEILDSTAATLNLAKIATVELGEAAAVVGSTMRGFGLDADQSGRVVDVMAKSFSSSALDMEKFRESMKLIAPIAATVKVPIEQATAAIGILADRGVSGSMAGTQLRRVLSDLATKTGKSFRESLEITAEKLAGASTESEKLAIATDLVGDRAKGSLIALAENIDALDALEAKFNDAGGAAAEMAEIMDNNLNGDLKKLSSAWEGFMLGLEDGGGIISKISRGAVQLLTSAIGGLQTASREFAYYWEGTMTTLNNSLTNTSKIFRGAWGQMTSALDIAAVKMKLAISDVPILGSGIDKAKVAAELAEYSENLDHYVKLTEEGWNATNNLNANVSAARIRGEEQVKIQRETREALKQLNDEFREGEDKSEDEANEKARQKKMDFLAKLKKAEEDFEAKTDAEKNELARNRHLAQLEDLKLTLAEKRELEQRINDHYNTKADEIEAARKAKAEEEDLAYWAKQADDKKKRDEKELEEKKRLHEQELALKTQMFDNAADIAGRETALGKAMLVMKQGLLLKEIFMNGKATIAKLKLKMSEQSGDFAAGKTKTLSSAPFPWNLGLLGGFIVSALPSIIAMKSAMRSAGGAASSSGISTSVPSASAPAPTQVQAPDFNVVGNTSAGENMLAGVINQSNSKPVKAYVVEQEVTTSQSMARKAGIQASIG